MDPSPGDPAMQEIARARVPVVTIGTTGWCPATAGARARRGQRSRDRARAMLDHLVDRGANAVGIMAAGAGQSYEVDSIHAYRAWSAERGSEALVDELPIGMGDAFAYRWLVRSPTG